MALRTNVIVTETILEDSEGTIEDFSHHFIVYKTKERKVIYVQTFWNAIQNVKVLLPMMGDTSDKPQHSLLDTRHSMKNKQCQCLAE